MLIARRIVDEVALVKTPVCFAAEGQRLGYQYVDARALALENLFALEVAARCANTLALIQLGGAPDLSPDGLSSRAHSEYTEGDDLVQMIEEELVAERIAIDTYREIIQYLDDSDPTTRRMLEAILASEEEHAEDLSTMLEQLGKKGEPSSENLKKTDTR